MKKKNLKLGKLKLSKSSIAKLENAKGGIQQGPTIFDPGCGTVGPGCTFGCETNIGCDPGTLIGCNQTQWPECGQTDIACGSIWNPTRCDCGPATTLPNDVIGF